MTAAIIGWDIGGANVKAALVDRAEHVAPVLVERPFALWRDPHRLPDILTDIAHHLGAARTMAATMTAELADCFATKREGVAFVLDALGRAFPGIDIRVFGVDGHFRSIDAARERPHRVAAANWLASATLAAKTFPDAWFIDVGSTTTDIIPLLNGRVAVRGRTDPTRLRSGELVYTGALRTPVCAIVRTVPLRGRRCRVAAEHFAIAADAHLWLEHIEAGDYSCETPDGRGRSREDAAARLARMVCADLAALNARDITLIADAVAQAQVRQIASAIRQVRRRLGSESPRDAIVVGRGAFMARCAAAAAGLVVPDIGNGHGGGAARLTPAAAVASLLLEREAV
jgi:probable H4MPT-linked C1 transfer pathway protein